MSIFHEIKRQVSNFSLRIIKLRLLYHIFQHNANIQEQKKRNAKVIERVPR